jgi:hypothetical protein
MHPLHVTSPIPKSYEPNTLLTPESWFVCTYSAFKVQSSSAWISAIPQLNETRRADEKLFAASPTDIMFLISSLADCDVGAHMHFSDSLLISPSPTSVAVPLGSESLSAAAI